MLRKSFLSLASAALILTSCSSGEEQTTTTENQTSVAQAQAGQSAVKDDVSARNIVQVAISSPDHTTLVAAVQAAELVDALSNAGPFTVFAPTNAAFDKLPAGTVEDLLKPENKNSLADILQYHVYVGVLQENYLQDGQVLGQVNGGNVSISRKEGKLLLNGTASILASLQTSNGVIHVIDEVLLPPAK